MKPIDQVRAMLKELVGGPDTPFMARREQAERFAAAFVAPPGVRFVADVLDRIPVEWVLPEAVEGGPVFLHLHGGGYVLGNPATSRPLTSALALALKARVLSVDYRLAPESPFPAAVGDSLAVYRELLSTGQPARSIAVGGESAGGGLAVALLVAAREHGLPMPAVLIALSPWVDMRCIAASFAAKAASDPLLTQRSLREMADAYLAGQSPDSPLASPVLADLERLPPVLIQAGSEEVLLDDATALHRKALQDGVPAKLEIFPEMIHVFQMFHPLLEEGAEAIRHVANFVEEHWRRGGEKGAAR
jgi:epsilon-lactone hydrolase